VGDDDELQDAPPSRVKALDELLDLPHLNVLLSGIWRLTHGGREWFLRRSTEPLSAIPKGVRVGGIERPANWEQTIDRLGMAHAAVQF